MYLSWTSYDLHFLVVKLALKKLLQTSHFEAIRTKANPTLTPLTHVFLCLALFRDEIGFTYSRCHLSFFLRLAKCDCSGLGFVRNEIKNRLHLHFTLYVHVTLNGFCGFSSKCYVNSCIAKVRGHWQGNFLTNH